MNYWGPVRSRLLLRRVAIQARVRSLAALFLLAVLMQIAGPALGADPPNSPFTFRGYAFAFMRMPTFGLEIASAVHSAPHEIARHVEDHQGANKMVRNWP
jgi:hypothetical protein